MTLSSSLVAGKQKLDKERSRGPAVPAGSHWLFQRGRSHVAGRLREAFAVCRY
jgi:hypothetical protein